MVQLEAAVSFISRLMIDEAWQSRGLGRATIRELIRRQRLYPEVELIAASHRRDNAPMARLLAQSGFLPWDIAYAQDNPDEVYLRLPHSPN